MSQLLDDALSVVGHRECWVAYTERVWLRYEDVNDTASGLYHWLLDMHVFFTNEYGNSTMIVCVGPPYDTEWHYYTDPDAIVPFVALLKHCIGIMRDVIDTDRRLENGDEAA